MLPAEQRRCPETIIGLADWTANIQRSALQEMLSALATPGLLSFALGLPAPELFPIEGYSRAVAKALSQGPGAFQYSHSLEPLKKQIVKLMEQRGLACREGQILLTSGAQQGLSLLTQLLLNPGGQALTEDLLYPGMRQVLELHQPRILTVPCDVRQGIDLNALEYLLADGARPAFLYANTDGHNPLGISLSLQARTRLVALAREYRMPILEDDAYGLLYYGDQMLPPLRAFDDHWVLYIGSFSKILMPALRIGWVIIPEEFIPQLSIAKEASDIDTATFAQRTASAYLESGEMSDHLKKLRACYRQRRDIMRGALKRYFPRESRLSDSNSGFFIWVELPDELKTTPLLRRSMEQEKVAFIPGEAFAVGNRHRADNCMRLNFSNCEPEQIEEGIRRLARAL